VSTRHIALKCLVGAATIASTANQHSVNPCLVNVPEACEIAGHQPFAHGAMPVLPSIQQTHASSCVPKNVVQTVNPQIRGIKRYIFLRFISAGAG
jgi:hypothetical protein